MAAEEASGCREETLRFNQRAIAALLWTIVLTVSVFKISSTVTNYVREESEFIRLAEIAQTRDKTLETVSLLSCDSRSEEIAAQYENLYEENRDLAGWIQIEGTALNYPVMYTPDDPEFYLHRAFDKRSSASGTPFIGAGCSIEPQSSNLIIYGHNMKNGTMFSTLLQYRDPDFCKAHPTIRFDTASQKGEYRIFSAFYIDVTEGNGHFDFYHWIDLDESRQQAFVDQCKKYSLYEIETDNMESSRFLTLVTCSYHRKNERFVLVAAEQAKDAASF